VAYDPAEFESTPPTDLLFSFGERVVPFSQIDSGCVGFDVQSLLDAFRIHRIFVPRGFDETAKELLQTKYGIMETESAGACDG
jgi:hypothetical protein